MHSYRPIDYLKLDVAGDEWSILEQLLSDGRNFQTIKQIGTRIHLQPPDRMKYYYGIICRLEALGFVRFFSRKNRWRTNTYDVAWFNANYSLNQPLSSDVNRRKDESLYNNKLPPIV